MALPTYSFWYHDNDDHQPQHICTGSLDACYEASEERWPVEWADQPYPVLDAALAGTAGGVLGLPGGVLVSVRRL